MGLRSWITIVSSREQLLETIDFAKNNAYGVSYVLQITSENAPFPKGTVIVAWSGDGDGSKEDLLAHVDIYWDDIILLDDFLDDNPSADWHGGENGPGKYGVFLTEEQCNTVEITNVPVSFYWFRDCSFFFHDEYDPYGEDWTLCEKIDADDFYYEMRFLPQVPNNVSFYTRSNGESGSFFRVCETLEGINRGYAMYNNNPLPWMKGKAVLAELEVPQLKHSNKVTIRYINDKLYIYYSINIEKVLKLQSWELARAFFDEQLESWRQTTQELFGASEIIIPWRADLVDTGFGLEKAQTVDFLHITIEANFTGQKKDLNKSINISDIQNNVNELAELLDIDSKSEKALVKIEEDQADTLLNISFCADYMYNELFNKKFSKATPIYFLVDNWHREHIYDEDDYQEMCISISPVGNAKEFDMVTIEEGRIYEDRFKFCYSFNIDILCSDDENKQVELIKEFKKELMSNKKQLESILSVNDWLKHHPGKPDTYQKVELDISIIEYDDVINFSLDTSSMDIYDLSKSIRIIDLLNNWRKIKEIVEKVLENIEVKR